MLDILYDHQYTPMWTAIGAIGQAVAAILAITALIYTLITFHESLKTLHYTELDRMYLDLLRIRLEKPYLYDPEVVRDNNQKKVEYELYAHMVWNFLETIHDRCERDKDLWATWYPVMNAESRLYRKWFDSTENEHKFKEKFRKFIQADNFSR